MGVTKWATQACTIPKTVHDKCDHSLCLNQRFTVSCIMPSIQPRTLYLKLFLPWDEYTPLLQFRPFLGCFGFCDSIFLARLAQGVRVDVDAPATTLTPLTYSTTC